MQVLTDIKCPYCDHNNRQIKEFDMCIRNEVIICDSDEGGCDRKFVITTEATTHIGVYKIVGQQEVS